MGTISKIWGLHNRISVNVHASGRFIFRFSLLVERDQIVDGGPWFFGKSMVVMAMYDGLGDPRLVALPSIPVWVHISGLPPTLLTPTAIMLVVETLGSVVAVDHVGLHRGDLVRVRIRHDLQSPVKQAFPPVEFEFSPGVSALLRFKYDRFVGFCKLYGLLEHVVGGCGGVPFEAVAVIVSPQIPNPNPTMAGSGYGLLKLGSNLGSSCASDGLIFHAKLLTKGGVQAALLLFSITGFSAESLSFQASLLCKPLFGPALALPAPPPPPPPPVVAASVGSPPRLSGFKCQARLALVTVGKRAPVCIVGF